MRFAILLLISMILMGSIGFADDLGSFGSVEPVTFNTPKKDPAKLKALIDSLLDENTTQYSTKRKKGSARALPATSRHLKK